ncbi:hypothetical protein TNCV_3481011 [Trichonephila clavipes]|nr:hypothetical protein TNCV_3481011 [Trichonephila clavipes]
MPQLKEVETDQAREEPGEIMDINPDSKKGSELAKVAKLATNLVPKNDANLTLYHQDFAKFSLNHHYNVWGGIACE